MSEVVTFIQKWKKPNRHNMTKNETQLLNEIKLKTDIVVVQADKGGKIVILDKGEYINKVEEKLNDQNIYQQLKTDPTDNMKKEIKQISTRLFKQDKITQAKKFELSGIDDLPTIRGQPKLHKRDNPMRIVTCSRDTILSPLSKFVFNVIKDLRTALDGVVKNTSSFVEEITDLTLDLDERLASLDIQDLFSNIPVNKAVEITVERLVESKKFRTFKN